MLRNPLLLVFLLLIPVNAQEQIPLKPFPQHVIYTSGSINPSNYAQSQLDNAVKAFYEQWKAVYLKDNCGSGQWVIRHRVNPSDFNKEY